MLERTDFKKKQILFLFSTAGDKLSFRNDNVLITDKEGIIKYQLTCYRIYALFVVGDTTITTGLIRRSRKFGFSIFLLTYSFKLYSVIGNNLEGNTLLHRRQYGYSGIEVAKYLVKNKIDNQRDALNSIRKKVPACKEAIEKLADYSMKVDSSENEKTLLGLEGSAARLFFPQIFDYGIWKGRKPRIKEDWINSSLDIGYTILFNFVDSLLQLYGFDVYCGVYHKEFYMRKSLVCDMMEPLRPIIDLRLRKAINLQEVKAEDFEVINNQYRLKYAQSSKYIEIFMEPILQRKDDIFCYIQGYYRCFMKQKDLSAYPRFEIK